MLSLFPRDYLDEIWDLIESVSEGFPTYFCPFGGRICPFPIFLHLEDLPHVVLKQYSNYEIII